MSGEGNYGPPTIIQKVNSPNKTLSIKSAITKMLSLTFPQRSLQTKNRAILLDMHVYVYIERVKETILE